MRASQNVNLVPQQPSKVMRSVPRTVFVLSVVAVLLKHRDTVQPFMHNMWRQLLLLTSFMQQSPLPLVQQSPLPLVQHSPLPLAQHSPLPLAQQSPLPLVQQSPLPLVQHSPLPLAQHSPLPLAQQSPLPLAQQSPLPLAQQSPLPLASFNPTSTLSHRNLMVSGKIPHHARQKTVILPDTTGNLPLTKEGVVTLLDPVSKWLNDICQIEQCSCDESSCVHCQRHEADFLSTIKWMPPIPLKRQTAWQDPSKVKIDNRVSLAKNCFKRSKF